MWCIFKFSLFFCSNSHCGRFIFLFISMSDEDEAPADRPNGFADRLAGIRIVAQVDRAQCAIPGTEAPGGIER